MLRALYFFIGITIWTALLFPCAMLSMLFTLDTTTSLWWARRLWSPGLLAFGGVDLQISGQENIDPTRPMIYASNHQSAADIPALFVAIPLNFRYVCKSQLKWVPFIGWYLMAAKFVFVDRGNRASAIASLDKAGKQIREGTNIVIYPEGTRSRDGSILPFKKGPFALALKARVPVVPVTIEGGQRLMPKGSFRVHPTTLKVKIGKPIDTTGYGDEERERLANDVRAVVIQQSLELGGPGASKDFPAPPSGIGAPARMSSAS